MEIVYEIQYNMVKFVYYEDFTKKLIKKVSETEQEQQILKMRPMDTFLALRTQSAARAALHTLVNFSRSDQNGWGNLVTF